MQTVFEVENLKPLVSAQFDSLLRHRWMCRSQQLAIEQLVLADVFMT